MFSPYLMIASPALRSTRANLWFAGISLNREMVVDDGTVTRVALAGKLLERSPYFDWFEFSLVRLPPAQPD